MNPKLTPATALVRLAAIVAVLALGLVLSGTSAQAATRDHDGMPTRWERAHGLNPRVDDARRDKDHDGLTNIAEFRRHLDPSDPDSDDDGVRDGIDRDDHGVDGPGHEAGHDAGDDHGVDGSGHDGPGHDVGDDH